MENFERVCGVYTCLHRLPESDRYTEAELIMEEKGFIYNTVEGLGLVKTTVSLFNQEFVSEITSLDELNSFLLKPEQDFNPSFVYFSTGNKDGSPNSIYIVNQNKNLSKPALRWIPIPKGNIFSFGTEFIFPFFGDSAYNDLIRSQKRRGILKDTFRLPKERPKSIDEVLLNQEKYGIRF